MKAITAITLEQVYRTLSALWNMNESTTIQEVAKELGVSKTDFYYFVTETHKWHFKIKEYQKKLHIVEYFVDEHDNPQHPEYLSLRIVKYNNDIWLNKVEDWGTIIGYEMDVDDTGWKNTQAKLDALVNAGLLMEQKAWVGAFMDTTERKWIGCKVDGKDEMLKALTDNGWTVHIPAEKVVYSPDKEKEVK